jgi:hypothetical protein
MTVMWLVRLKTGVARPCARGRKTLPGRAFVDVGLLHEELVDVDAAPVLGVRDGRLERLRDDLRAALRRELEDAERLFDLAAADEIDDQARLLCREARVPGACASFHGQRFAPPAAGAGAGAAPSTFALRSPEWP